jgi:hypothetical protein
MEKITRQQDCHPDYWIHQFLNSKYITDDEENELIVLILVVLIPLVANGK